MGYIASDIGSIRVGTYRWYLFLLEDGWQDDLRSELSANFEKLSGAVGPEVLVVRGHDREQFAEQVRNFYAMALARSGFLPGVVLPALLLTDIPPRVLQTGEAPASDGRALVFSLAELSKQPGSIPEFLKRLVACVRHDDGLGILKQGSEGGIRRVWSWLSRYIDLKPGIFGFGVDVKRIVDDLANRG